MLARNIPGLSLDLEEGLDERVLGSDMAMHKQEHLVPNFVPPPSLLPSFVSSEDIFPSIHAADHQRGNAR